MYCLHHSFFFGFFHFSGISRLPFWPSIRVSHHLLLAYSRGMSSLRCSLHSQNILTTIAFPVISIIKSHVPTNIGRFNLTASSISCVTTTIIMWQNKDEADYNMKYFYLKIVFGYRPYYIFSVQLEHSMWSVLVNDTTENFLTIEELR